MNSYVYRADEDSNEGIDPPEACTSFLECYARGNIDVGGPDPPESAIREVPLEILCSGQWAPPPGPDEAQRVRELYTQKSNDANGRYQYRVLKELNHDIKLGFDKFARLATLVCGTRICIVNFLDDKTQYTSVEVAPTPMLNHTHVQKQLSICAHAVLRNSAEVFEIPDCTKDWRFKGKVDPLSKVHNCSLSWLEHHAFAFTPAHLFAQDPDTTLDHSVFLIICLKRSLNSKPPR